MNRVFSIIIECFNSVFIFSMFSMLSIFSKLSPCSPIQDYRTPQFVEPFSYISHSWHNMSSISLFWDCLSGKFQSWGQNAGQRRAGHTTWPHTTSKHLAQLGELELEAASCGQASYTNHLKSWPSRGSGWKSLQLVCLCHNLVARDLSLCVEIFVYARSRSKVQLENEDKHGRRLDLRAL